MFGPLRERDFALLWTGTLVSLLGDGIFLVALPFALLDLGGSAGDLSLFGVFWQVGLVAFLLLGGIVADRYDKRRQLLASEVVRLLAVGTMAGLSLGGVLEIWHLWLLAFVFGSGEGFAAPATGTIVPELVPADTLVQANSLQGTLRHVALRLIGPGLGGVVVAVLGTSGAFVVDAGTFVVAIACLLAMRARVPVHEGEHEPLRDQLREAARFVRRETWLWATLVMAAISVLAFLGPAEVLLPIRIDDELGGGASDFGLVLAAAGVGATIGSIAVGQLGIPRREITALYWFWGLAGFALIGYAFADAVWQLIVAAFLFGLGSGAGDPIWTTLMQVRVPVALRGRVASLDWLVSLGLTPVSFGLTGPLAALVGPVAVLAGAGVIAGAATLLSLYVIPGLRAEDGGIARANAAAAEDQPPMSDPMSSANVG